MSKASRIILLILATVLISNAGAYPVNVTDDFGYETTIQKQPERIVSLSHCNTEILFAVGAGDRVVGGTTYDAYPPEAVDLPKIGGFSTVNIEAVVNLTPDLILAEDINGEDTIDSLRNLGFTVITFNPQTMDDILENIWLVGNITGNGDTAESVTDDMIQQIELEGEYEVAVCGPPVMYGYVIEELLKKGLAREQIWLSLERHMKCGVGKCGHCFVGGKFTCRSGPVYNLGELDFMPEANECRERKPVS